MITYFEDLCNELVLSIFEFINPRELFIQFGNLNSRLNEILLSLKHLNLIINDEEDETIIARLAPHIGRLYVNTWDEIDLNGFDNLYSLSMIRPSPKQLRQIRAETMPNLIYLLLFTNVQFIPPNQLIYDAFSNRLPSLRWARLGHIDTYDPFHWSQSYSLRSLHISCYHISMIQFILAACPNLQCLHVDISRQSERINLIPSNIPHHSLQQFILRDFCRAIPNRDLRNFISLIPNTKKLELNFSCTLPFVDFLQHLANSLQYLCKFDCDICEESIDSNTNLKVIYRIHPSFCRIRYRIQGANYRIFTTQ